MPDLRLLGPPASCPPQSAVPFFFFKFYLFIYLFSERGERRREISMGCLLFPTLTPSWGPGPQSRLVPQLGTKPVTSWFEVGAQSTEPHQPGLSVSCLFNAVQKVGFLSRACKRHVTDSLTPISPPAAVTLFFSCRVLGQVFHSLLHSLTIHLTLEPEVTEQILQIFI